jgi:hypothetical protein
VQQLLLCGATLSDENMSSNEMGGLRRPAQRVNIRR